MNSSVSAQVQTDRTVLGSFDREFARLHARSSTLIDSTPIEILYQDPRAIEGGREVQSIGEYVLRSAGAVEQTFGGLTSNLWDDPFEWTLPETLSTSKRIMEYLDEVEQTRKRAFDRFLGDDDLLKMIAVPAGVAQPLVNLLLDTLVRAIRYEGRAVATKALFSQSRT
jgi:hypothetical protein